jgi:hypothetical protein
MIKLIKRKSDNKFLQSVENDLWVDDAKQAYEMSYRECEEAKSILLNTYTMDELTEVFNLSKSKQISEEEKKEILAMLKNRT